MTLIKKIRFLQWRSIKFTIIYYCVAILVFALLSITFPVKGGTFLLFIFVPSVLIIGIVWGVISIITIRRIRSTGSLVVHIIVIALAWWLIFPGQSSYSENEMNNVGMNDQQSFPTELMPTFKKMNAQQKFLLSYSQELKSWQVHTEELDIGTDFGKTHIISFGNPAGKPLILLHWFCSNSLEWKYMAPFLQERFHVYAVDVIGDMGKSLASRPPKSEKEISQWFNQVLDSLKLTRVSICGHSNGGFQAMLISQQNPARIEKLIMLAPAAVLESFKAKFYLLIFGTALFPNDYYIKNFERTCSLNSKQWSEEMTEMLALSFRSGAIQVKVYPRVLTDAELMAVKVPTLLIMGNDEFIYSPVKSSERAFKFLPDIQVINLPNCGHAIPFDAPKDASEAIESFLSKD